MACLLGALAQFTLPYLWYYANYEYIVTELCVNRFNPDVECEGYCQLHDKVRKQHNDHSEDAPQAPAPQTDKRLQLFYSDEEQPSADRERKESRFRSHLERMQTLWYGEPVFPPPKAA
ncbi:MAG: hypothetical protein U5K31_03075 [Balneolaceae bacterium]|nr:hypothetical protein [Balneolaceae bacterium]